MTTKKNVVSPELEKFIRHHFENPTGLEVLKYFFTYQGAAFTKEQICNVLYLSETLTEKTLQNLSHHGLLGIKNQLYFYQEDNPLDAKVKELIQLYTQRKSSVLNLIYPQK